MLVLYRLVGQSACPLLLRRVSPAAPPPGHARTGAVSVESARTEESVFNIQKAYRCRGKRAGRFVFDADILTLASPLKNGINDDVFNKNVRIP